MPPLIDRGHHGAGVRRVRILTSMSAAGKKLSIPAAVLRNRSNLRHKTPTDSIHPLLYSPPQA